MSFASDTKNELVSLVISDCCAKAELSALTRLNGIINISSTGLRIEFQTQNATIARRYLKLIRQLYEVHIDLLTRKQMRLNKGNIYIIRVTQFAEMIINDLQLMNEFNFVKGVSKDLVSNTCCKRGYLRGAFLASGSVNNPEKSAYHLELLVNEIELAKDIQELMNGFYLNARVIERKKGYMIYIKESEKISDFLRVIQATNAVLDFEDIRIYRDINNSVNRIRNCEVANLNKSWDAANMQTDNISLIMEILGLDLLPVKLQEAAVLRLKFPESTLTELSECYLDEYKHPISKSGLNHRYRKINLLADRLRNNESIEDILVINEKEKNDA